MKTVSCRRLVPLLLTWIATQAAAAGPAAPPSLKARVALKGLVCSYCAQGLLKRLKKSPGFRSANVRLDHHDVELELSPGARLSEAELRKIVQDSGLGVEAIEFGEHHHKAGP